MGAQNVSKVYTYDAWRRLGYRDKCALIYMAHRALDEGKPPVYYAGWEDLARAMGIDWNPEIEKSVRNATRQVEKTLHALRAAGAIESTSVARRGIRAEYAITLDRDQTWACAGLERGKDGILRGRWTSVPRPPKAEPTHQKGGMPTHQKDRGSTHQEGGMPTHQKGTHSPTKKVGPRRDAGTTTGIRAGSTSPEVVRSPADADATAQQPSPEQAERERQMRALRDRYPELDKDSA